MFIPDQEDQQWPCPYEAHDPPQYLSWDADGVWICDLCGNRSRIWKDLRHEIEVDDVI